MTVEELVEKIRKSTQHRTLYHFTDEANFSSIFQHGLLSKAQLRAKGLWPPAATGGNDLSRMLDLERGIDPFVSLCMTQNHRMKFVAEQDGRLPKARYLKIDPAILLQPATKIAFGVSNANDARILAVHEAVRELDVEVLYERTNWNDPVVHKRLCAAEKFEVLIKDSVLERFIVGVC